MPNHPSGRAQRLHGRRDRHLSAAPTSSWSSTSTASSAAMRASSWSPGRGAATSRWWSPCTPSCPAPSARQAETLRALCAQATLVTVFTETARRMVVEARHRAAERVRVRTSRCPDRSLVDAPVTARRDADAPDLAQCAMALERLEGRTVLSTFGLISAAKGIELAISALPTVVGRPSRRALPDRRSDPPGGGQARRRELPAGPGAAGPRSRPDRARRSSWTASSPRPSWPCCCPPPTST